jgi:hypothetical protein
MHMVGHQDIGMQGDVVFGQGIAKKLAVADEVFVIEEGGGAIDAPMRDVKRESGQFESWTTRHGKATLAGVARACRQIVALALGMRPRRDRGFPNSNEYLLWPLFLFSYFLRLR